MKVKIMFPLMAAGLMVLAGCGNNAQKTDGQSSCKSVNLANLDTTVAAGADFYQYACGGWMKEHPLKPEFSRYGVFEQLMETNREQLRALVEELKAAPQEEGSVAQKIGMLYELALDSVKTNEDGFEPVKEELAAIRDLGTKAELSKMVAYLHKEGITPYFALYVGADEKNSSMNIVQLYQAGLGMGDRDYYLQNDETFSKIREAYKAYISHLFVLAGHSPEQADAAVTAVMNVENGIAKISFSREEMRDSQKNYNKMSCADFIKSNDALDWNAYFSAMGLDSIPELDAKQFVYYKKLGDFLKTVSLDDQKCYLAFNLLRAAAPYLSDNFVNANFDFYGKTMSGKQELEQRWKRALSTVNGVLGEAVGQMYVAKYFPASSKEKMLTLVGNLQKALGERINNLEWMGDSTKLKAQEKLAAFTVKIGYPDKWRDYSALEIKQDSYWANVRRSSIFEMDYMLADAGKPVDKSRWYMTPQTINAYYNPGCYSSASVLRSGSR